MGPPEEHSNVPAESAEAPAAASAHAPELSPRAGDSTQPAGRKRRGVGIHRVFVRFVATGGVIGVGVALGAILAASKVQGWITGLVVALVSVLLAGVIWSSKQL